LYTARMECYEAAADGNLDLLKQLRESGYSWDKWTCLEAAVNGHLDILQWARKNGCPWDKLTCAYAAWTGHLETLQWAIANGCDHDTKLVRTFIDRKACVEGGVFPGHGCLVSGCSDDKKSEGLCAIHIDVIRGVLEPLMCNDTAKLVLEIVCAPN